LPIPGFPVHSLAPQPASAELERRIRDLGAEVWEAMRGEVPGIFNGDFWQGKLLDWAMRDPEFRVDLFRFVDVLPALNDRKQVFAHLKDYLLREDRELPAVLSATLKAASGGLTGVVAVEVIKRNLVKMAENFIVGETPKAAIKILKALHREGIAFTADLLGEATLTADEGEEYLRRYRDLIQSLADETSEWKENKVLTGSLLGAMPLAHVSIKVSALDGRLDPVNAAGSSRRLFDKLKPLLLSARKNNVAINIDLESWSLHEITYRVFESLAEDPELKDWPFMGIVVQAYLRQAPADMQRLLELARKRGAPLAVRLVKGAYWDYEVALAQQRGYPCPVINGKAAVDAQYESLSRFLLDHIAEFQPAFGSHNLRSLMHALAYAEARRVPQGAYELQMLYGMAEPERAALRNRGHRVRVYAPVGALLPGMAYLVRRLLENTSNSGFLRQTYHEHTDLGALLKAPTGGNPDLTQDPIAAGFANCPSIDFGQEKQREAFSEAVERCLSQPALTIPAVIAGKTMARPDWNWVSPNPGEDVVARITLATAEEAYQAIAAAHAAFPAWDARGWAYRAALLNKLADILQSERLDLAALQIREVAKPWAEADADVGEAIDFCRYYARQAALELHEESLMSPGGEANALSWQGRGVCSIIAPWNFPLAILTGMATAALVAGNTVILKPAEQSSAMGYALYQAMMKAGFPKDVVHFLPGKGENVGPVLVGHPHIAQIAFTGSYAVGLSILRQANEVVPGQHRLKRVICELGGKNAAIVDDDADLDEAVAGVARSAFGYAGQKCSAASRLFIVGAIHDIFLKRLIDHTRLWKIASATDPGCDIPPVIDDEAAARLRQVIASPGPGAEVLYVGNGSLGGRFVPPAIIAVDSPRHRLMQEEFFGPILAVSRAESFEQALGWVGETPYALTGALYSRRPSHIAKARAAFRVGNLYINRPCTGAMVGRQPFGGFGHSGLGTKAGGPGYLRQFADPRAISESTMRHGFAPETST